MWTPPEELVEQLGLDAGSPRLIEALTHSSFAAERGAVSNERLEFLGDAVVDLAVADLLVTRYPELDEGAASLVRSHVVNEAALAEVARGLDLGGAVRLGRGERRHGGADRPGLLADAFEAVVAAIYLDRGYDAARDFVQAHLGPVIDGARHRPAAVDPKTRLRQWAEANGRGTPTYRVASEGPPHATVFTAEVTVGADTVRGEPAPSRRAAEALAAEAAWEARDA